MRIKEIHSSHRNDYTATMVCEHCGHVQSDPHGYNDANYHDRVIPRMKCGTCGLDRSGEVPGANPEAHLVSKHTFTPGPWEYVAKISGSENHKGFFIRAEKATRNGKWALAEVQPGDEDGRLGEENAKLIAAAPVLLAACTEFSKLYGRLWDGADVAGSGYLSPESVVKYDEVHALMSAAIAAAT